MRNVIPFCLLAAACNPTSNASSDGEQEAESDQANSEESGGTPSEEAAPEETPPEPEMDPWEAACRNELGANETELSALIDRISTVYPESEGAAFEFRLLGRRPTTDETRALVFGELVGVDSIFQASASVTPEGEFRSFMFMRANNARSRSSSRFTTTIGEHSVEVRIGDSTNLDDDVVSTACWFDLEFEREGGGAYGVGATFILEQ